MPLVRRKQHPVKSRAVEHPQQVDGEMPPSRRPDRVADARNAQPLWKCHRVVFGRPYPVHWHRMLKAEPFGFRRAIPVPIEARVIREYLDARPDDERHEEQIEEVLQSQPQGVAGVNLRGRRYAWVAREELLKPRALEQLLTDRDPEDQNDEGERYGPQYVDPLLAQADSGHFAPLG